MKHTEGNWFVSKSLSIQSSIKDGSVGTIPTIAQVNTVFREEKESLANAKLIAAAPELLKACQSFVNDFELDYMLDGEIVDKPSNLLLVNYEIAKKAVLLAISE